MRKTGNAWRQSLMAAAVIICMAVTMFTGRTVYAETMPTLVPQEEHMEANAGDRVRLVYTYTPAFANEKVETRVLNKAGKQVAHASKTFNNKTVGTARDYAINWPTDGIAPGTYTIESKKSYYQDDAWHEVPGVDTRSLTLICVHSWDTGVITKDALCLEPGTLTYTCLKCGETREEEIPPVGEHKWDEGVVTKEPDCTYEGVKTFTCSVCKETKTESIPVNGEHAWDEGTITREATCTMEGLVTYTCRSCGETKTEDVPKSEDHAWDLRTVIKEATCKEDGEVKVTCSFCGETKTETIPATGEHAWDEGTVTKPATQKEAGVKTFKCTVCGETKTEEIPKLEEEKKETPKSAADSAPVLKTTEKAVVNVTGYGDPAGSSFAALQAKAKKVTASSVTLAWKKVKGASGYIIYGNQCGKKNKYLKLAIIKKGSTTTKKITKINGVKLKKGTSYKFIVVAVAKASDGTSRALTVSKSVHCATSGNAKYGNFTGLKLTNPKKGTLTLKKGKTFTIKATQVTPKGLKVAQHKKLAFESSDPSVARVSKSGKITAKKKGTAAIYVYTQNGLFKTVKVTVK